LEDLEKELNDSCNCCEGCTCGDDCSCTEDNKCCDECTCDKDCKCETEHECNNCKCNEDNDEKCDCNKQCNSDEECKCNCNEECECDCKKECDCENMREKDSEYETASEEKCDLNNSDNDKCKCGCGEEVEESETTSDAYFSQLLSLRAEFDNYRKRTQNDISQAYKNGFNQAITEFLPALDSFKMATEYITDANTLMGIQYIEKGILSTLEKMGITVIDTTGKFDPNFHQAIGSEVSSEHESGDIIKECFKGFKVGDKIIRYSQVIVAK